ncbi:MAG: cohesin domain-containing protein [Planctomycetales bacterium]
MRVEVLPHRRLPFAPRGRRAVVSLCAVAVLFGLLSSASEARAQAPAKKTYKLAAILSGFEEPHTVPPFNAKAEASGGLAEVRIKYSDACTEQYRVTWAFDRDITYLSTGDEFNVTVTANGDNCHERDLFAYATGSDGILRPPVLAGDAYPNTDFAVGSTIGKTDRVYTDANAARPPVSSVGTKTATIKVWEPSNSKRLFFLVSYVALSPLREESSVYHVAYLYDLHDGPVPLTGTPAPPGTATPGTPSPGTTPATPGTPGTAAPGDPCQDPATQACIDRWLDKLVGILNRRAPERAPWSISRYGHLVNNQTRSVAPPDEWDTRYRSSKHCFVWIVYSRAHLEPIYGGELPPLHEECGGGASGGTGTTGTGTTGTGTGGVGTGSGTGTGTGTGTGGTPGTGIGTGGPGGPGTGVTGVGPGGGTGGTGTGRILEAERRVVAPGNAVVVPVRLLNPDGVANMNFEVAYDPQVVRPLGAPTRGSLLGSRALFEVNTSEHGRIRIGFAQQTGLSQSGIVAQLPFQAIGSPGERSPLTLTLVKSQDQSGADAPAQLIHGEIAILADDSNSCDCDGDGLLTVADAICSLQMSVGLRPKSNVMDADGDGDVTSGDAREILRRIP